MITVYDYVRLDRYHEKRFKDKFKGRIWEVIECDYGRATIKLVGCSNQRRHDLGDLTVVVPLGGMIDQILTERIEQADDPRLKQSLMMVQQTRRAVLQTSINPEPLLIIDDDEGERSWIWVRNGQATRENFGPVSESCWPRDTVFRQAELVRKTSCERGWTVLMCTPNTEEHERGADRDYHWFIANEDIFKSVTDTEGCGHAIC
jgi:hypothetical protein